MGFGPRAAATGLRAALVVASIGLGPGCSLVLDFSPLADAAPPPDASGPAHCDTLEPNEDVATAQPAGTGPVEASICPGGDLDFYSFTVDGAQDVVADVTFRGGADTAVDLTLYDSATGDALVVAPGIDGDAKIEESAALGNTLVAGDYAVEVNAHDPAAQNDYELTVTITAQ
jgi:hypothetical protein